MIFLNFLLYSIVFASKVDFMSLKSNKVNVRVGPGLYYPIIYQYRCIHFPLKVLAEFMDWIKIYDVNKKTGWIHKAFLTKKRFTYIKSSHMLFDNKDNIIAYIYKGSIGRIIRYKKNLCYVEYLLPKNKRICGWSPIKCLWGCDN